MALLKERYFIDVHGTVDVKLTVDVKIIADGHTNADGQKLVDGQLPSKDIDAHLQKEDPTGPANYRSVRP